MRSWNITGLLLLAMLIGVAPKVEAQGQQGSGTPYSAYGFGSLIGATQVEQILMGGTGIALTDPYSPMLANPASYPGLVLPSFQTGALLRFTRFDSETQGVNGNKAQLMGFSLAVPFGKGKWGMALGLSPVSDVSYRITDQDQVSEGAVTYEYSGNGGLNRAFLGLGRTIWQSNDTINKGNKLTLGANLNYVFGTIEELRKAFYPAGNGYYNGAVSSSLVLRAPTAGLGLQWTGDLYSVQRVNAARDRRRVHVQAVDQRKEQEWLDAGREPSERRALKLPKRALQGWRYRIGLTADLPSDLFARHTQLATSFVTTNTGAQASVDTAWSIVGSKGNIYLPLQVGLGVAVQRGGLTLTAEHRRRDWQQVRVNVEGYNDRTELQASGTTAFGLSYRPAAEGGGSLVQRIIYRAGARYSDGYVTVAGERLNEIGMSFGISLPVMGSTTRTRLNFGTEVSQRGSTSEGLIRERSVAVMVGLTITPDVREQWFKKRRIE